MGDDQPKETVEIVNQIALRDWLRPRSRSWGHALAARVALRVLPLTLPSTDLAYNLDQSAEKHFSLPAFWAGYVSWVACYYHRSSIRIFDAASAAEAIYNDLDDLTDLNVAAAGRATGAAAAAARSGKARTADTPSRAASRAASAVAFAAADRVAIWKSVSADVRWLAECEVEGEHLISQPLWLSDIRGDLNSLANLPDWARDPLERFWDSDRCQTGPWGLVVQWYRQILSHRLDSRARSLFGIERDILIATKPQEFWERDPDEVMAEIADIVGWVPPALRSVQNEPSEDSGDQEPAPAQRPAAYRFELVGGKLNARLFDPDIVGSEADRVFAALCRAVKELSEASRTTNSPLAALLGRRAEQIAAILGESHRTLDSGDLLAEWDSFQSVSAVAETDEGRAELPLVMSAISSEVERHLSSLAALSPRIGEIVAIRQIMRLSAEENDALVEIRSEIVFLVEEDVASRLLDPNVGAALRAHQDRIAAAQAAVEAAKGLKAKTKAQQNLNNLRALQLLDLANFGSGVIAGSQSGLPARAADEKWATALTRLNRRLARELPGKLADATVELAVKTIRDAPIPTAFAALGMLISGPIGAAAGLAPLLFDTLAKRLTGSKSREPDED